MKYKRQNLSRLWLLLLFLSGALTLHAQAKLITLDLPKGKLREAIEEIKRQTDYQFFYEDNLNETRVNSVKGKDLDIHQTLSRVLAHTSISYKVEGRVVYLSVETVDKDGKNIPQQEKRRITGKVFDVKGESLIGVNILEAGTANGVITDMNGIYSISLTTDNPVLKFTYIGFKEKDVPVGKQDIMDVVLDEDVSELEEVVVVGYGQQKKASVIGAISSVKPEVLQTSQTRSLTNSLGGQIAGIIAVQRSGEPGYDDSDFWIRGINTFGANANPLVLIDGIERSMNNISPEEIESFSVLKDATATAVYGVRGANGVILIQTKKGKVGKARITVKADYGISNPTKLPDFAGAPKYMEVINEAQKLSDMDVLYSHDMIEKTRVGYDPDLYPDVNWIKAVTKENTPNGRISFDINGGSERLRYSLIGSYFSEDGMIVADKKQNYDSQLKLKKYNMRSNVDLDLTSSTRIAVSIGGYVTDRNAPGSVVSDILWAAMDTPPNAHPKIYSDGKLPKKAARLNPWLMATQTGYRKLFYSNIESSLNVTQDIGKLWSPLEGLTANALVSFDAYNVHWQDRTKTPRSYFATGRDEEGELIHSLTDQGQDFLGYSRGSGGNRTLYFEGRLNYSRYFNEVHHVDGLFLFNARDQVIQDAGSSILALPYRNMGIAGRAAYSYKDIYFTEFNFGYNGSENFKRGYRFGFFPSFALGWMVSNEPFMQPVAATLSKLKIRGSWGLVGNDRIVNNRRFAYISTIDKKWGYGFGYTNNFEYHTSWHEGDFGVDNMTWETARKMDLGIELGLWNSINVSLDLFKEYRENIFMQRKTIPETAGYNVMPYANFGKVENHGVEADLVVNHQFSKEWFLSAKANFTFARNKITEYDEPEALKKTSRARTGQPLNQHFGLIAEGLYREEDFADCEKGILKEGIPVPKFGVIKPGDIKYKDINGDKIVDSFDETPIGKPYVPEIVYGFGINTRYKNMDLGLFFQGTGRFSNMLYGAKLIPGSGGGAIGNIYDNVDDRWTPENPRQDVFWPRLSNIENKNNMRHSTWWLRDVSYIRLKNMEIGYTLPKGWQQPVALKNARLFFRGTNLLTFSKFKMWDPEIGSSDGLQYPLQKIYTVGVELTF